MAEQTLQQFKEANVKPWKNRKMKVTNSWGTYDCYKAIRRNKWYHIGRPVKEKEFYAIIREVNNLLAENIANGETVVFPEKMGRIELRRYPKGVSIKDGHLKNTYPINWGETWKLWHENEEEREKRTLLRYEEPWVFHAKYVRDTATYENKTFYQFVLNRFVKKALKENIKSGKTYTMWMD